MMNKNVREVLISLSLSNLLFLASWRELLYPATYDYHVKFGPNSRDYLSVVLCIILTSGLLLGLVRLFQYFYKEKAKPLINLTFLLFFVIVINIFRLQFLNSPNISFISSISYILSLIILVVTLTKWRGAIFNLAKAVVLMLSPFVLITFSQAFMKIINPAPIAEFEKPVLEQLADIPPRTGDKIKSKVVWIIFDEFDYRVPFELKPIELPEFERLKNQSLSATQAKSPAWATVESLPSLLTGKKVNKSEPLGKKELILNFSDGTTSNFSETRNIFFDVKEMNGNIAVLGWYHPYCRLFGNILSVCKWEGVKFSKNLSLPETMLANVDDLVSQMPVIFSLIPSKPSNRFTKESHFIFKESEFDPAELSAVHNQRLAELKKIAADPNIDLVFFHLPIPHAPVQYNRFTKEFTPERQDYINNIALCDIVLGEIRKSMEEANEWDNSTVIISSDHQWRINSWKEQSTSARLALSDGDRQLTKGIEDPRIPFFVKLKNQNESLVYEKPLNTVMTRDLILSIMKGEISSPEELKNRLDAAGNIE
jgi:hypothetical protein